jgi:nicotinamidase-related amidase
LPCTVFVSEVHPVPIDSLDPRSALVLIDLQRGITALPVVHDAEAVVARGARLADAFRARGLPVVLVRVTPSPDGGDALAPRADAAGPRVAPSPDFADLRPEVGPRDGDLVITKRGWDAFYGTELDLQLRRRGVREIVLAGISTSIGVEGTARQAFAHGYDQVVVSDAVTDMVQAAHDNSVGTILPRIARLAPTDAVLEALERLPARSAA